MSNYSKQREIILNVLTELHHPTAEEIYESVHLIAPIISKSTVYRNINVLLENKIIKKIKVLNGPDKYDYNREVHYHVICKKCGTVFDFKYNFEEDKMRREILSQTGVQTNMDSIILYGICEKCKTEDFKEE